jgi:sugar phosphate isomerase/epimerase
MNAIRPFAALLLLSFIGHAADAPSTVAPASTPVPGIPIGWCTRANTTTIDQAKAVGFEYVELALQDVLSLSNDEFTKFAQHLAASGIPARSGYNPLPNTLKLVGAEVDEEKQDAHLQTVLARAAKLKLQYVILNSAGAWRVPDGFPPAQAFAQLAQFCRRFADQAAPLGITVLIEPQRTRDTNMIITITEALALVQAVNRPSFQLMVDYSFLRIQKDDLKELLKVGDHLKDVHLANPEANRTYPLATGESNYAEFFALLKQIGYRGGLSVHAGTNAFETEAPKAIAFLREMARGVTDEP